LKRSWTKYWLCISLLPVAAVPVTGAAVTAPRMALQGAASRGQHIANELTLAGFRPGRDLLATAEKRFKVKHISEQRAPGIVLWRDDCSGHAVRLEVDAKGVIQAVTVTTLAAKNGPCGDRPGDFLDPKNWTTGRGLRIGDPQDRVMELYGDPNSNGPALKDGQELDLLSYQFDWAGSDVPQVMEVLCDRDTGRVLEITLAFPVL
jgi:hypothetical protein